MNQKSRIGALLQYLEEDPGDAFSKYALALEYVKTGNDTEAARFMEDLSANTPGYLPNYYHYGKLLERLGEFSTAVSIYKRGIEKAREQNDPHTASELRGALEELE